MNIGEEIYDAKSQRTITPRMATGGSIGIT
jgi:hypothetical protein